MIFKLKDINMQLHSYVVRLIIFVTEKYHIKRNLKLISLKKFTQKRSKIIKKTNFKHLNISMPLISPLNTFPSVIVMIILFIVIIPSSYQQLLQTECGEQTLLSTVIKRQKTGTSCQINYYYQQSCQSDNTISNNKDKSTPKFTFKSCLGHTCKLAVGDKCYHYQSQPYSIQQCLQQCCLISSSPTKTQQNYSAKFQQCIQPQISHIDDSISLPSNKTLIIICCLLGVVMIGVIVGCICCRERIGKCVNFSHNTNEDQHIHVIENKVLPQSSSLIQLSTNELILPPPSSQQPNTNSTVILTPKQQQTCTICLNQNCDSMTSCSHSFHILCLAAWLNKSFRCPNCTTEEINPITVFCKQCKRPFAQIKMNKTPSIQILQNFLGEFKCNQCKIN